MAWYFGDHHSGIKFKKCDYIICAHRLNIHVAVFFNKLCLRLLSLTLKPAEMKPAPAACLPVFLDSPRW